MTCCSNKTVCPHFHIAFQDILNWKFSQKKTGTGGPWTHITYFLLQVVRKECRLCSLISHHFARTVWKLLQLQLHLPFLQMCGLKLNTHIMCLVTNSKVSFTKTSSCNLPKYVWFPLLSPILLYQYYVKIISYISCVHPTCLHLGYVSSHLSLSVYWHFIWRSLVFFFHHQCTQNDRNMINTLDASWNTRLNDRHLVWLVNNNNSYCSLRTVEFGTIWDIQAAYTK
jgi:hypothetical protein